MRAPTNGLIYDYVCAVDVLNLSATAAGASVVRTLRVVRAAGRATVAGCVALVRATRRTVRTLVVRRTIVAVTHIALVIRGAVVVATYITLMVVRIRVRRYVGLSVRILVGRSVRTGVGILVGILVSADMHVGTCTNVDRNRSVGAMIITEATAVTITPLTHLAVIQDSVQIASVLVVPTIDNQIQINAVGIAIAAVCPLQVQVVEFRLLTRCKIEHHSHIAGHTLCLHGNSLATTTDGYFDGSCAVCGCCRCCIDGKKCRHCYC